jgi:hypothetical protein
MASSRFSVEFRPYTTAANEKSRWSGWNLVSSAAENAVTDQERQKAEELIGRLELAVGQMFPRDGGNAALLTTMIQTLNGLRSLLGIVRPH